MSNKKKLSEIRIKLKELNTISTKYNEGIIGDEEYSQYLKSEIESLKRIKIEEFKTHINKGLSDIKMLKNIKNKLEYKGVLTEEEKLFISLYL